VKKVLSTMVALVLVISMLAVGCGDLPNGNGNGISVYEGDPPAETEQPEPVSWPHQARWVPLQGVYEDGFFWTGLPAVTPEPHIFTLVHLPLTEWGYDTDEEVSDPEESKPVELEVLPNNYGVVIGLPQAALDQGIEITVEKVDDPREQEPPVPFPDSMKDEEGVDAPVVGGFYSINSNKTFMAGSPDFGDSVPANYEDPLDDQDYMEYLVLGFPVPENTPSGEADLWVAVLVPPEWIDCFGACEPLAIEPWISVQEVYDGDENSNFAGGLLSASQEEPQCCWPDHGHLADAVRGDDAAWPSFIVLGYDFDVVSTGFIAAQSPPDHRTLTRAALRAAREAYRRKGFPEPRLRLTLHSISQDFQLWPPRVTVTYNYRYQYLLEKGDSLNGYYNGTTRAAATIYTGHPQQPPAFIAHHELFHAVQWAYRRMRANVNSGPWWNRVYNWEARRIREATATAAEMSLYDLTRSNQTVLNGRYPYPVTHPLWSSTTYSCADYAAQDFMVYIGRRFGQELEWMIPWFKDGGLEADLDALLQDRGWGSLGDYYWGFAQNQAYNKVYFLGPDHDGRQVPHTTVCDWSGHGSLRQTTLVLETGAWIPETLSIAFTLPRYSSRMLVLVFPEGVDGTHYRRQVTIRTNDTNVKWRFYGLLTTIHCGTSNPSPTILVLPQGGYAYLLVSNTGSGESRDISLVTVTEGS